MERTNITSCTGERVRIQLAHACSDTKQSRISINSVTLNWKKTKDTRAALTVANSNWSGSYYFRGYDTLTWPLPTIMQN